MFKRIKGTPCVAALGFVAGFLAGGVLFGLVGCLLALELALAVEDGRFHYALA